MSGLVISGLVISGLVMSGLVISGLVMSGLVLSGLIAVVLCRPPFIVLPPMLLICAMVTLTLGYFNVEFTNSDRETVLRGIAITSTKFTQLNPAAGVSEKMKPLCRSHPSCRGSDSS